MINSKYKIYTDLFYGDSGKGTTVDWHTRTYGAKAVIRTSGGSQPAHNVETPEGVNHCFRQFGSGALVSGVKTILTKYALINPCNISIEMRKLMNCGIKNPLAEMYISENCLVITPFHVLLNKVMEASRENNRHGSVGMGVGQAVYESSKYPHDAIFANDLKKNGILYAKLLRSRFRTIKQVKEIADLNPQNDFIMNRLGLLMKMKIEQFVDFYLDFSLYTDVKILPDNELIKVIPGEEAVIFEPTQGVLLDPVYGFWPHVTKTRTTSCNARKIISELGLKNGISETGIIRAYATRHGAGPFVTEEHDLQYRITDKYNIDHDWQGRMRYGWLDLVALRYALMVNGGVDDLAVTCLDQLDGFEEIKVCNSYEYTGKNLDELNKFFVWGYIQNKIKVICFKPHDPSNDMTGLTKLLFECIPLDYVVFPGWKNKISKNLPLEAKNYLSFLESKNGLGVPIRLVSIGPTWQDKILL